MENRPRSFYRSLFWPVILIGVGLIWLLGNLGLIPAANLSILDSLWPLILIVIGLDMLVGRGSPLAGALIGMLAVAAVIVLLAFGPALGIKPSADSELKIDHYSEPLGSTTSLAFQLHSGSEPVSIHPVSGADKLLDATIGHYGQIEYTVSGGSDKTITLDQTSFGSFHVFNFGSSSQLRSDIGLAPSVPLDLQVQSGSGSVRLDLGGMKLTHLRLDSGSGSVNASLPETSAAYVVESHSGSGSLTIRLPANTDVTLRSSSGSGSLNFNLPAGAAVRVEVTDHGSGSLNLPGLNQVSGSSESREGVWESQGYAQAAHKILIQLQGVGSGSINIR